MYRSYGLYSSYCIVCPICTLCANRTASTVCTDRTVCTVCTACSVCGRGDCGAWMCRSGMLSIQAGGAACPKSWKEARSAHASHNLRDTGPSVFCQACGGHTSGRCSTALRKRCCEDTSSTGGRRLRFGRHPVSNMEFGPVRPGPDEPCRPEVSCA